MIRYSLICGASHAFEAWFRSSADFDAQRAAGHVGCAICGSTAVEKAIMAPAVTGTERDPDRGADRGADRGTDRSEAAKAPLSTPASPAEAMLTELRRNIERSSDYVGRDFAAEARRIHDGEADKRSIWGEASLGDAKALSDDGIPVAPIPWMRRSDG